MSRRFRTEMPTRGASIVRCLAAAIFGPLGQRSQDPAGIKSRRARRTRCTISGFARFRELPGRPHIGMPARNAAMFGKSIKVKHRVTNGSGKAVAADAVNLGSGWVRIPRRTALRAGVGPSSEVGEGIPEWSGGRRRGDAGGGRRSARRCRRAAGGRVSAGGPSGCCCASATPRRRSATPRRRGTRRSPAPSP
jgi:hypothetical protein